MGRLSRIGQVIFYGLSALFGVIIFLALWKINVLAETGLTRKAAWALLMLPAGGFAFLAALVVDSMLEYRKSDQLVKQGRRKRRRRHREEEFDSTDYD